MKSVRVGNSVMRLPESHAYESDTKDQYREFPSSTNIPSNIVSSSGRTYFDIESHSMHQIECSWWKIDLTTTSELTIKPIPYIWQEVRCKAEKGSGREIFRYYPEQVIFWLYTMYHGHERKTWQYLSGFRSLEYEKNGTQKFYDDGELILRANENRVFIVPIPNILFHTGFFNMQEINDLRFEFDWDANFVISGTTANLTVNDVSFLAREHQDPDRGLSRVSGMNYLDVNRLVINNKAMTASATTEFVLDQFSTKSAFLLCFIRGDANPTARNEYDWYESGPDSKWDILSESGVSSLGNGRALTQKQMYKIFSDISKDLAVQGMYIVPFTKDLLGAINGVILGYRKFNANNERLEIQFDATPTSHVQNFQLTNAANDSGSYQLFISDKYESDVTINLAFNATAAAMKSAIEATSVAKRNNLTVTVSGSATTTFTVTFDARNKRVSDYLNLHMIVGNLADGGVGEIIVSQNPSIYGVDGFTTLASGSNSILIYNYYYRRILIEDNKSHTGKRIHVEDY